LRRLIELNNRRKCVVHEIASERLAYQEFQSILDELDKQVEQTYLKRLVRFVIHIWETHFNAAESAKVKKEKTIFLLCTFDFSASSIPIAKRARSSTHYATSTTRSGIGTTLSAR
jgi:hypothetical protein